MTDACPEMTDAMMKNEWDLVVNPLIASPVDDPAQWVNDTVER